MKPPKSKMSELAHNATGGGKSHAETAESAEFKMTELGPIPLDWEVKRINQCGDVVTGSTPPRGNSELWGGSFNWISAKDFKGKYIISSDEKVTEAGKRYCRALPTNSVLVTCIASIGLNAIAKRPCATNQQINAVVCRDCDYEYFYYQCCFNESRLRQMAGQTAVPIIGKSQFEGFNIVLPKEINEQRRIAEALSDVDELISALGKLIEKKRNIKTGAMQELLTGKTRLSGFKGKWVEKTFCEFISRFATGLNPRQNFKLNSGGNNYYITIKDFKNGKISFNGCDKIDDLALRLINERSDLRAGDLLFSSIGRVGDAYVIKETPSNWNINESVFSLRPDARQMDVNFLYYLVKSNAVQERLTSGITGSTLTGIKIGELRGIVCFYPSDVVEQKAIAAVLSDMDAEIAALEAKRAKYESIKQGMMQELLTGKTRLKGE